MKARLFTTLALILFTLAGWSQQDRAIRDTGGGSTGDGSVVFHKRLTFGDEYSLPIEVLDTSDIVSIYGGAQTSNPTTITLPDLGSSGAYDGKKVEIRGSGSGEAGADKFIVTHATTSTDLLVLHCQTGAITGNDTIHSTLGDIFTYYISNDRYYRYCEEDVVHQVTNTGTVDRGDGQPGDIFINTNKDTIAFITHSFPFVIEVPLGGGSDPNSTLSYASFEGNAPNFSITTTQTNFTSTGFNFSLESGADWAYDSTNDEMDYTGPTGIFLISYVATGTIGAGSLKTISMVAEKNNSTITGSLSTQIVTNANDDGVTFAGTCFVSLSNGDSINLAMFVQTTTAEFDCDNASMTAFMLPGQ